MARLAVPAVGEAFGEGPARLGPEVAGQFRHGAMHCRLRGPTPPRPYR